MGVWMIGKGDISINPPVDEELIKEYIQFSKRYIPEEYRDEWFPNPWFFDENNKLISIAGKFAEPSIWYRHIKKEFLNQEDMSWRETWNSLEIWIQSFGKLVKKSIKSTGNGKCEWIAMIL